MHQLLSSGCYNHISARHKKVSMKTRKDYWKENLWELPKPAVSTVSSLQGFMVLWFWFFSFLINCINGMCFQHNPSKTENHESGNCEEKKISLLYSEWQVCSVLSRYFRFNAYLSHKTRADFNWLWYRCQFYWSLCFHSVYHSYTHCWNCALVHLIHLVF